MVGNALGDWASLRHGVSGNDLDEWDPQYIRRTLPLMLNLLDLPLRLPLPAKITVDVLPPIDLRKRFGPNPDHREVYEQLTGDMQQALTGLADERTAPILG